MIRQHWNAGDHTDSGVFQAYTIYGGMARGGKVKNANFSINRYDRLGAAG